METFFTFLLGCLILLIRNLVVTLMFYWLFLNFTPYHPTFWTLYIIVAFLNIATTHYTGGKDA